MPCTYHPSLSVYAAYFGAARVILRSQYQPTVIVVYRVFEKFRRKPSVEVSPTILTKRQPMYEAKPTKFFRVLFIICGGMIRPQPWATILIVLPYVSNRHRYKTEFSELILGYRLKEAWRPIGHNQLRYPSLIACFRRHDWYSFGVWW